MDKSYVKSVLVKLKSISSREIQDALLKIKTNIISNEQGIIIFRECGGLDYILPHIKKPNERTLDISLSILGNLCLDEQNSLDVAKSNIFGSLVSIINTVKRDSLLGRTSRLIGNLSQIESNAESFHNYGAVQALVTLINNRDKSTSYPTLIMAVRALRLLWMVEIRRHEMLSISTVFCISQLLCSECQSMGLIKPESADIQDSIQEIDQTPKKSQQELISGILKCMGYFSTCQTNTCVNQIGPRGISCLVALMDTHDTALKCLLNLCYIESARPHLGVAGLVEGLVNLLEKESDVTQWPPDVVKALTLLCRGSTNRARLRLCGGLNILLKAAKYNANAFRALLLFSYDENSFLILVKLGLVDLVTDKLRSYVSSLDYEHSHKDSKIVEKENHKKEDNTTEFKECEELTPNVSKETICYRKSLVKGNSHIEDAINYESEVRKRRKILKRAKSCNYDTNNDTSDSSSESDAELVEPSIQLKNIKCDFISALASDGYSSGFSSEYGGSTASKRARFDWSPESGVSTGDCSTSPDRYAPWSPSSSGPTSPISINEVSEESDSELSGRYSPVCGEPDEEEDGPAAEPEAPETCNMEALVLYESDNEPLLSEEINSDVKIDSNSNIVYIVNLLFRVAFGRGESNTRQCANTIKFLADERCINSLLDYISKTKRPIRKVTKTLLKVMGHSLCLMDILKHRLPLRLYRMSNVVKYSPTECFECKKVALFAEKMLYAVTTNAESRYGIGQISHKLLKGTENEKRTLTTVLPYVAESTNILKIFLLDCDALNLLFSMISDSSEDMETCTTGLSLIAHSVNIKNPKLLEQRYKDHVIVEDDPLIDNLPESDIVTFLLDDLSTVNTSKSFLCENSEVFSAMLMGQFKESSEKTVQLKNVSQSALKYLITLLQFGLHESTGDIEIFPVTKKLETSLEVLLLVDRFLFDKLKDLLRSAILQFQLTPETADKIYFWSLEEGMGFLCVEAVAFILTGKMKHNERLRLFNNILQLEYKNQWLDDIKGMLLRQLKN